jgi:hypothetical protein
MDREVKVGSGARLVVRGLEDDGTVRNVDIELVEESGARWSATVLTLGEIDRLMTSYHETGECLSGSYFRVPDLLILNRPTFESLIEVVEGLLRDGTYPFEFSPLDDES